MNQRGFAVGTFCAAFVFVITAGASTPREGLLIQFEFGAAQVTTGIAASLTTGALIDGMAVSARFGAITESIIRAASGSGAATGSFRSGWSLRLDGDAWGTAWTLSNQSGAALDKIIIDAGSGNAVFDISFPQPGTEVSSNGKTFSLQSGDPGLEIMARYRDVVSLEGLGPVGDLYRRLAINSWVASRRAKI